MTIRELKDERERAGITTLLTDILEDLYLAREVFITLGEEGASLFVRADSEHPVVCSGYRWLDDFEDKLTRRASRLVPHAEVDFEWSHSEEELEELYDD